MPLQMLNLHRFALQSHETELTLFDFSRCAVCVRWSSSGVEWRSGASVGHSYETAIFIIADYSYRK